MRQKLFSYCIVFMTLALSVGVTLAQEEEVISSSSASGLAQLTLLIGILAILSIFFLNWSQSQDDDEGSS